MAARRLSKSSRKIMSFLDLNDYGLDEVPEARRQTTKQQVGDYIVASIKQKLNASSSPVQGEGFKTTLSEAYRKYKVRQGGGSQANLRLFGDLLNSLKFELGDGALLGIGHTGTGRDGRPNARKCVGHCHFEKSDVPRRRYLPARGQSYDKEIEDGIKNIVEENKLLDLEDVGFGDDITQQVFDDESLLDLLSISAL